MRLILKVLSVTCVFLALWCHILVCYTGGKRFKYSFFCKNIFKFYRFCRFHLGKSLMFSTSLKDNTIHLNSSLNCFISPFVLGFINSFNVKVAKDLTLEVQTERCHEYIKVKVVTKSKRQRRQKRNQFSKSAMS